MASRTLPRLFLISHFGISQVWFSKCLYIPSRYIRIGCAFPALSCVSGTPFPPNSRSLGRTSWSSSQVAAPSLRIFLGSLGRAWLQCASHVKSNQSKYQRTSSRFSPLEILYSTVFCHVPLSNRFFFFILHKLVRFCNWLACSHAQYYTTKKSACQFNFGPILKFFYGQHC